MAKHFFFYIINAHKGGLLQGQRLPKFQKGRSVRAASLRIRRQGRSSAGCEELDGASDRSRGGDSDVYSGSEVI